MTDGEVAGWPGGWVCVCVCVWVDGWGLYVWCRKVKSAPLVEREGKGREGKGRLRTV